MKQNGDGIVVRRRGLILLGAGVIGLCIVAPAGVADGRLPRWANVFWDIRHGAHEAAGLAQRLIAALPFRLTMPSPSNRTETAVGALDAAAPRDEAQNKAPEATLANQPPGPEAAALHVASAFYRSGDFAAGDAAARALTDPDQRTALEWIALRDAPEKAGFERITAFAKAHPAWPSQRWLRNQFEAHLFRSADMAAVRAAFTADPPHTPSGKLVFARALRDAGRNDEAAQIVRALYRDGDLTPFLEGRLRTDFSAVLQKADYKYRADRFLYKEDNGAAMRTAALGGPDVLAYARARAALPTAGAASAKVLASVPAVYRADPGLLLAQIQKMRRSGQIKESASFMLGAPRDPAVLINPDEWWVERRLVARKLLDIGEIQTAYEICAAHSAISTESKVEAEFHAGWIALRFLNKPAVAATHFAAMAAIAISPSAKARAAYWQGRTMDATPDPDALAKAKSFYEQAALYPSAYYGQAARALLGTEAPAAKLAAAAPAAGPAEPVRVIAVLFAAGERDAGRQLAFETVQSLLDEGQAAALAQIVSRQQDAHLSLTIGKMLSDRGFRADDLAFPAFGIPRFEPLGNSAPLPVVYSVARQESAFNASAVSRAGAKGLMQMIDSTARQTAVKAGLPFDETRLLNDAAFNAQLGAAHLGALIAEQGGSYILTFAAYNAGGRNVRDWIAAYGDPRDPGVDPIDWVERIPFTETRNYVERVMANVAVYTARFAAAPVVSGTSEPKKILAQAKL